MTRAVRRPVLFADEARADAELLARIGAGELDALGALYDRHHVHVRRFVERATGRAADVDDLVHDIFLTVARAATRFDGRESARPFLLGVAAQLVRRRRRSLGRLARAISEFGKTGERTPRTPEQEASALQERDRFEIALASLSDDKRIVFLLFEGEGLTGEQIARALEVPVNTVWTRLHHARTELRLSFARKGWP